ncbi:hypothetical protein E0Z10_g8891 [Xylaria hypoxylon]|uniref:Pyoverdine/dityrosine biosynthesis protein n=1 Tax=Xylaria hypoxylon TaxID=37992 RepID=A0A4Z0YLS8_9PEZI|nr:hypothetical protein E0Z10_g8891 [Xylaria hypoxylon]
MDSVHVVDYSPTPSQAPCSVKKALQPVVSAIDSPKDNANTPSAEKVKRVLQNKCSVDETAPRTHQATAVEVLDIITSYGVHSERNSGPLDTFDMFLPIVTKHVAAGVPVRILLPGFPFKENSKNLVVGSLPDLGEELALAHLQGLCDNISARYEKGAEILICSDGLVYNGK